MRTPDDTGAVIIAVVLLVMAMLALAHALLLSAQSVYVTARIRSRAVGLRAAADGAARRERADVVGSWVDTVSVGGRHARSRSDQGGIVIESEWRRLGSEAWIIDVWARRTEHPWVATSRQLVWLLDPGTRVGALPGVVSIGVGAPVSVQGTIVTGTTPAVGTVVDASLGQLEHRALVTAGSPVGARGRPRPAQSGGACDDLDPWNWGDPDEPSRPCGDYWPLKQRVGSLELDGGGGQGILAVDGDLTLLGGAYFRGLVVVTGEVVVEDGSRLEGRVIALAGVRIGVGSVVSGSADAAYEALRRARAAGSVRVVSLHPAARLGPG